MIIGSIFLIKVVIAAVALLLLFSDSLRKTFFGSQPTFSGKSASTNTSQAASSEPAQSAAGDASSGPNFSKPKRVVQGSSTTNTSNQPSSSGFFSSTSVKTLLVTGSALFISSVYLFVRSYWGFVPDSAKFFGLLIATLVVYFGGFIMTRKETLPKTAHTLLVLGLLMIPFVPYAANVLLFAQGLEVSYVWMVGALLLFLASLLTSRVYPAYSVGLLIGISGYTAVHACSVAYGFGDPLRVFLTSLLALALLLVLIFMKLRDDLGAALFTSINMIVAVVAYYLLSNRFFVAAPSLWPPIATLLVLGGVFAILSRSINARYAYLASASVFGAVFFNVETVSVSDLSIWLCFCSRGIVVCVEGVDV